MSSFNLNSALSAINSFLSSIGVLLSSMPRKKAIALLVGIIIFALCGIMITLYFIFPDVFWGILGVVLFGFLMWLLFSKIMGPLSTSLWSYQGLPIGGMVVCIFLFAISTSASIVVYMQGPTLRPRLMSFVSPWVSAASSSPVTMPAAADVAEPIVTPVAIPTATTIPCTDNGAFIADVTIPDKTIVAPGASLIKTWRVKNIGTCTWTTVYSLVFLGGDQMQANPVFLPRDVVPGQTVDVSIQLTAPQDAGLYRGEWGVQNAAGKDFPVSKAADGKIWVEIIVLPLRSTAAP